MPKFSRLSVTFLLPFLLSSSFVSEPKWQENRQLSVDQTQVVSERRPSLAGEVTLIQNKRLVFDGTKPLAEHLWNLKELNPQMPVDWSSFKFLVVEMRAASAQRFQIRLHSSQEVSPLYMHPLQNTWVRAAIPLEVFKSASKRRINRQLPSYFMFHWGPYLPLNEVESISIAMPEPIGRPMLEIRSIRLTNESPGDAVLENEPLVDEMGQWIRDRWPGKVKTISELQQAWKREEQALKPSNWGYCRYGGYCSTRTRATGFFRVELIDGKWWLVDPDGHLFFSTGVNVIAPRMTTPTAGRMSLFKELPPENLRLTNPNEENTGVSFYLWNVWRRFGDRWRQDWLDLTVRRMQAWGLNTVGSWSADEMNNAGRFPYTLSLNGWETSQSYLRFPDVYSEEFVRVSDAVAAKNCAPRKDDPFLIGYFIANEPAWVGREETVVEMILAGADTATKRELKKYLAGGDTPERRKAFVYEAYEKYLEAIAHSIRKYDPNHLILGIRFTWNVPDEIVKASTVFDVFSINLYGHEPVKEKLETLYDLSDRPIMLTEFHFGTPGRGMSAGLKQVRDQKERGLAYRYYVENAAAMPMVVGTHWFQWMDQPSTGRYDGENYNIGLVDVTDRPYPEMIEAMKTAHRRLHAIRTGKQAPIGRKPLVH